MNWKYILIIILAVIIGGGILAYQYWWLPKENAEMLEAKPPGVKTPEEVSPKEEAKPPAEGLPQATGPIDCKNDFDCFIEASQNCEPARMTHILPPIDLLGLTSIGTMYYELRDVDLDRCTLYIRLENTEVKLSEELIQQALEAGSTQEQIQEIVQRANEQADLLEGRDGTCKFNINDLTTTLSKWKEGKIADMSMSCKNALAFPEENYECTMESGAATCLGDLGYECVNEWSDFAVAECQGDYFYPLPLPVPRNRE